MSELWVKLKPWAVGTACGWVLLAFVFLMTSVDHPLFSTQTAIKIYDTTSDIVLLKWVTKYQTLLAGLAAVIGGLATVFAAKMALEASQETARQQHHHLIISNANYLSELFRQSAFIMRADGLDKEVNLWEGVSEKINSISPIHPQFCKDLIYLWHRMRFFSQSDPTSFALITVRTTAYIAATVLNEIVQHHQSKDDKFNVRPIPASVDLIQFLEAEEILLQTKLDNASVIGLIRPMDEYIDFTGTKYENA